MSVNDIYAEVTEFMTSQPSLEAIAEFRLSESVENFINELLDANRNRTLTAEEQATLDDFIQLEHFMRLIKFRALEKLEPVAV